MGRRVLRMLQVVAVSMLMLCLVNVAMAQLNENCTVSVLNRTVRVNPDGSWVLPNIPANFGPVKARATCVKNGVTTFGESDFFTVPVNGALNLPRIILGPVTQIPASIRIAAGTLSLTASGQTTQLVVTATYPDKTTKNITVNSTGTNYTTSNPVIATVSANGLVTAMASGTVVIQATNDGAAAMVSVNVVLSGVDTDGDGIPDDAEIRLGLDPKNPVDAKEDYDRDGLTNLQDYLLGTDIRNPDTDGDGLSDGDESNKYKTNALLADTDKDLIPDGVEIQNATNPLDKNSYDLNKATLSSVLTPSSFVLTTSLLFPIASQQLSWKVNLIDGKTTLDLTADSRTTYISSNLTVCNFGAQKGLVLAGNPGSCTITISNGTLSVSVSATVQSFTPQALAYVDLPGYANNVDVNGNYAFVAAGSAGLQVVDVSDHSHPRVVASCSLPGNANDVIVVDNYAYVAAGSAGLQIVNISDALNPVVSASINTGGLAWDVMVKGAHAYVANDAAGLLIIDVSTPSSPRQLGSISLPGTSKGVDVDGVRQIAVVALGANGLAVVNVANSAAPVLMASLLGGDVRDLAISGNYVFLADFSRSFTSVDLTNPSSPVLRNSTAQTLGGLLQDVAVYGSFVAGADVYFINGVPLIDVSIPDTPQPRSILDFRNFRDDNGTGIAMDQSYVYLTAEPGISENGVTGTTRLYIGQYRDIQDNQGIPPTVQITSPVAGAQLVQGSNVTISANATDDVAVAAVTFFVNGQVAFTTATAPYKYTFSAPSSGSTMTLGATASDFGGNVGQALNVTLSLIPDPLTTVTGRVVNESLTPLSGASVSVMDRMGITGADGAFSIPNLSTIKGNLVGSVRFTHSDGTILKGESAPVPPVQGGTTVMGDIVARAPHFALVGDYLGGSASIIDFKTNTLAGQLVMGVNQHGAAVTPDGSLGLLMTWNGIIFIDLTATPPVVIATIVTPQERAVSATITPDGRFAIIGGGYETTDVRVVDIAQRRFASTISTPGNVGSAITPDGALVLVLSAKTNQVSVLQMNVNGTLTDTGQRVNLSGTIGGAISIAITPNGRRALIVNATDNSVTILAITNGTVTNVGSISVPDPDRSKYSIVITRDGRKAYISNYGVYGPGSGSAVSILSIDANDNVTDTGKRVFIPGSVAPSDYGGPGLAVTPDGTRLFIVGTFTGKISILDIATDTLLPETIVIGGQPMAIGMPGIR